MKKQMIAIALAASFAAPAFAGGFEEQMFDTQPEKAKVVELSQKEMRETEGAYWGGLAAASTIGAVGGHYGYVAGLAAGGGKYNPYAHGAAVLTGGAAGAIGGPISSGTALIQAIRAGATGVVLGSMNSYANTLGDE